MSKYLRLLILCALPAAAQQQEGWWMRQPLRWIQTNLREVDAALDPHRLVNQLVDFRANVLHIGMGGITAFYPTRVNFHYPSSHLPPGADLMRDIIREAHAKGIKVVGRFDFSKTHQRVYEAHPEWFFRKADGNPVIYNGLYSTCINGGYYHEQALKILAEALENYEVDGLFFNMFGNQARDYSGNVVGLCHCEACSRKYRQEFGRELPSEADDEYRQFLFRSSREMAARIGTLIREKRPHAGYFNYIQESTDGIMSESNTAVDRPLPLWPYASSDHVNRARNSEPGKMSVNLNMQFVDYEWRFATVPQQEIALRIWQNVAHGGAATLAVNGTLDHEDRQAIEAARPVFQWLAANEGHYVKQQSAARLLLLGASGRTGRTYNQAAYRGLFRSLTEEHIPFAVSDNMDWLGKREFDVVLASDWAPAELARYVENGGKALIVSSRPPDFPAARVVKTWNDVESYFRIRNYTLFPSLKLTNLVMLDGMYSEPEGDGSDSLTLVPPSMFGPPERIHIDFTNTTKPGVAFVKRGQGEVTWIPWDLGALYYRHSLPAHAGILRDLLNRILPERQIRTSAHPLVETVLMRQGARTLLHLVNLSGHSQTGYFSPVPMSGIRLDIAGSYTSALSVRKPAKLVLRARGNRSEFVLPQLEDYELVVLE